MSDDVIPLLKVREYFRGVSDDVLEEVVRHARVNWCDGGSGILSDAGCDNDDILSRCQGPRPHVRGCWVVDLVLGKT